MKITVTKLDVARGQLETAIELFFKEGDSISIHTLSRAAHEILETIGKKQGFNSILEEGYEKFIPKEKQKEVRNKLSEVKNFSKHGSFDSDKSIEFQPELNTYYLWDSARLYLLLTKNLTKNMAIFQTWFSVKNPDVLTPEQQQSVNRETLSEITDLENKKQFYHDLSEGYDELRRRGLL